jgi:hypothetical protein
VDGSIGLAGGGNYWTSNLNGPYAYRVIFGNTNGTNDSFEEVDHSRAVGAAVRCIKN